MKIGKYRNRGSPYAEGICRVGVFYCYYYYLGPLRAVPADMATTFAVVAALLAVCFEGMGGSAALAVCGGGCAGGEASPRRGRLDVAECD